MSQIKGLGAEILEHLRFFRAMGVMLGPDKAFILNRSAIPGFQNAARRVPEPDPPTVTSPEVPLFPLDSGMAEDLQSIRQDLGDCRRCKLGGLRLNLVFGVGNPKADLLFVGEAPGADEDEQGIPFVGKAGQLLTRIIQAMGLHRDDVYICNILKCRPPGNRNPEGDEIAACKPFLIRQIASVRPRVICSLGNFGTQTLLGSKVPISKVRGHFIDFQGAKLMATFHPSYLLRNPHEKRSVWEDVQKIRDYLRNAPV